MGGGGDSHGWGLQLQKQIFGSAPWGPEEGSKCQVSLHLNNKVNFKDFMCVFFIKHIKRDFCSDAWVMPQGWDLGQRGARGGGGSKFNFRTWSCGISN